MNPVKTRKKSYLFLLPWSLNSLGGVNQVVENLYYQMKSDDQYDPLIMVNSWDDVKIRKENINEIDHYFFRLRSPWNSSRKIYNFFLFLVGFFRRTFILCKFIKKNKVSTVNIHYCSLSALNISLLKALGIFKGNFILSFHGGDLSAARKCQGIEKILWKLMLKSADKITTCSESLKDKLTNFDNRIFSKTIYIHNGINIPKITNEKNVKIDHEIPSQDFILNVATLDYNKGQDILLKAFEKISKDFIDICLVLVGRPGGAEKKIKQLIASLNLSQRVHLCGGLSHEKVLIYMEKSKIFVLPSRYEAFGIVILEAGAFEVPVIASDVGGICEIITHNKTGRLFETENVDSLANELRHLLTEAEERKRLGRNLKKHVLENFSWRKTYKSYLNIVK